MSKRYSVYLVLPNYYMGEKFLLMNYLERLFLGYGRTIAKHPLLTIILCLLLAVVSCCNSWSQKQPKMAIETKDKSKLVTHIDIVITDWTRQTKPLTRCAVN